MNTDVQEAEPLLQGASLKADHTEVVRSEKEKLAGWTQVLGLEVENHSVKDNIIYTNFLDSKKRLHLNSFEPPSHCLCRNKMPCTFKSRP